MKLIAQYIFIALVFCVLLCKQTNILSAHKDQYNCYEKGLYTSFIYNSIITTVCTKMTV